LLVDLLNSHPSICCEGEILHDPILLKRFYIACRARLSLGEVYGFKLLTYQLNSVQKIRDPKGFLHGLFSSGYRIIYLSRRDILRHALSNLYARHRNVYHHHSENGPVRFSKAYMDLEELMTWMRGLKKNAEFEQRLLDGIPHLPLVYEDNLLESEAHQPTIDEIADYLCVPSAGVRSKYVKGTPSDLWDFVENCDELVSFVEKTEFGEFIQSQ
jgi:LPS sulfotransferase NodH